MRLKVSFSSAKRVNKKMSTTKALEVAGIFGAEANCF